MSWSPRRSRVWMVAVALALASGALKWWAVEVALQPSPGGQGGKEAAPLTAPAASASGHPASRAQALRSVAPTASAPSPTLSPRALRMQADWCGFGAAEASREESAGPASPGGPGVGARTDGEQVTALARQRVLQRWAEALRRRGDPRSLALAEWIVALDGEPRADLARSAMRLQALASTSTDPMVTVLALSRPCEPGVCRNVETSQWSRLEPENVQAWLALTRTPGHTPDYLLERMATVGRYSRNYQQEVGELLLSVLQFETPGLENQAESELLLSMSASWSLPTFAPLTATCRRPEADALTRSRCEAAAGLLWSQGSTLERAIALSVAGSVVPKSAGQRRLWESRATEYEAVRFHSEGGLLRLLDGVVDKLAAGQPCDALPLTRQWARASVERSDWDRARAELQASGADLADLSRQWRNKEGRSALERPRRTGAAASSPG
ncbi:hypothetical protein [Roseateles puraquae]|uniref:hypothetical protein n=1 Tax=Roseateles puraquae TaxID=431059 RepID=UPI0031E015F4